MHQKCKKDLGSISNFFGLWRQGLRLIIFSIWTSSCFSTVCWKGFPFSVELLLCLLWKSGDGATVSLFLDSVLIDLSVVRPRPYFDDYCGFIGGLEVLQLILFLRLFWLFYILHVFLYVLESSGQFLQKHLFGIWTEFWAESTSLQ